jgi:hypothetical protein
LALSTREPLRRAQVEQICHLDDDVYCNRWITFAYWRISRRLQKLIGANASWCTFSAWSSRTIGENLRLDKASRRVDELIKDDDTSIKGDDDRSIKRHERLLLELQYRVSTRDDGAAQRSLALGNRLIFHEIGYAMIDFVEWVERHPNFSEQKWAEYRQGIEPYEASDLFPAGDVEQLRGGLECYYHARHAGSDKDRAELVLQGNVLLGAYEQWRADPLLKVALDPFPGRLVRVVRANPHSAPQLSLPGTGTPWALRHHSPILRALSSWFGAAMTRWVMALDAPLFGHKIKPIRVGHAIPPPGEDEPLYPQPLEELDNAQVKMLFGLYDRSQGNAAATDARNWTRFPDRMNFIANLFRAGQQDDDLYRRLPATDLGVLDLDMSWSKLDELRKAGDSEIDDRIDELIAKDQLDPRDLVRQLVTGDRDTRALGLPASTLPAWTDDELLEAGQIFFRKFRLEIASSLFCASLPTSYTAGRGARVLVMTARLVSDAERRIAETGQMLLDAMADEDFSKPPLRPGTRAYEAANRVRRFHGAVRHMIRNDPDLHWRLDKLGMPINQEDLLGTLAVFTVVVIASLDKMGVTCTVADRDAYFHLWLVIGHLLGIHYDLLYRPSRTTHQQQTEQPLTYADMQLLARIIFDRNAEASADGQELTAALLNATERSMPPFLKAVPRALIRRLIGDDSADLLGVPPPGVTRLVVAGLRPINAVISPFVHSNLLGGMANGLTSRLYRTWIGSRGGPRPSWLDPLPIRAARRVRDEAVGRSREGLNRARRSLSGLGGS